MEYYFVIGIIVCDKDYQYFNSLIDNIKSCVKGKYTIVVYNNCIINYDNLQRIRINNVNIIPNTYKHKNSRQLYARKMIAEEAYKLKSDYIWFVDADDSVKNVNFNKFKYYTDIIVFPYAVEYNPFYIPFNQKGVLKVKLNLQCSEFIQRPLWCKCIKTDIIKKAYDMIDAYNLPPISCSEDTLVSLLSMKFSKTFSKIEDAIHFHNTERSNSDSKETHFYDIEQITIGIKEVFNLFDTLFTEDEYVSLQLDLLKYNTILWIVNRICMISDKKELKKSLKSFNKKLGNKYIKEYLQYSKK